MGEPHCRQAAPAVAGLALLWPALLNGSSFPYSLTQAQSAPQAPYFFLVAYAAALGTVGLLACAFNRKLDHCLDARPRAIVALGPLGCAGALLLHATRSPDGAAGVMAALGMLAFALYSVGCLVWWANYAKEFSAREAAASFALSWVAAALINAARFSLALDDTAASVGGPLLQSGTLAWSLAALARRKKAASKRQSDGLSALGKLDWCLLAPAIGFVFVSSVCVALFNAGSLDDAGGVPEAPWRIVMPLMNAAVFGIVLLLVLRGRRLFYSLVTAFGLLSVLTMSGMLLAVLLARDEAYLGSLPSLVSTVSLQVYVGMVTIYGCARRGLPTTAAMGLYVAAAVAAPKALKAIVMLAGAHAPMVTGATAMFVWSAVAALIVSVGALAGLLALVAHAPQPATGHAGATGPSREEVCAELGRERGLTERETEVLQRLASGHSAKRIAEDTFISETTVNTHVRRIYAKVGVHSKQELIRLVEERSSRPLSQ